MASPALKVEDLTTEIRLSRATVHAVGNVDLEIGQGETLGLVGESGSRCWRSRSSGCCPTAAT
jgi:ABC-type glutathione transport system ATPase component